MERCLQEFNLLVICALATLREAIKKLLGGYILSI